MTNPGHIVGFLLIRQLYTTLPKGPQLAYSHDYRRVMTIVPNLQEATTSDSDSERTLYDRPNRTSRTDRAESGHDSSEIFFPYTAPFSSIVPALTSFTKQPQVTSFQPLKETKWQRPPFLPTLNSHPRLVYPIVVLTLLSAGLITGLVVFVIHQNHILVGEESSPDNEGKDDGQELSPLILFIDASPQYNRNNLHPFTAHLSFLHQIPSPPSPIIYHPYRQSIRLPPWMVSYNSTQFTYLRRSCNWRQRYH